MEKTGDPWKGKKHMEKLTMLDAVKVKSNLIKLYNLLVKANNMIPEYGVNRKYNMRLIESNSHSMQMIISLLCDDTPDFTKYIAIGGEERNSYFEKYSDLFHQVQPNV
jgi:hypothetical protein